MNSRRIVRYAWNSQIEMDGETMLWRVEVGELCIERRTVAELWEGGSEVIYNK